METRIGDFVRRHDIRGGVYAVVGSAFHPLRHVPRGQIVDAWFVVHKNEFKTSNVCMAEDSILVKQTAPIPIPRLYDEWTKKFADGT